MEVGSHVCSSVLSNGFSHKEYRPLRLRSCFCPFVICEVRILLPGGWGEGSRWVSASGASFVWWWWFVGCCYPLYYSSAPDPELSFNVYQPPRPECCLWPSSLLRDIVPWPFTAITSAGTAVSTRLCLWLSSLSFPLSYLLWWLQYAHLQMFQCEDLSDMFVCWVGTPLSNYSYLTCCNFKRRELEILSCHHAANVTPNIPLKIFSVGLWLAFSFLNGVFNGT